jgi:tRNA(Ile)-lysidine synthase
MVDASGVGSQLIVRYRRPGDRLQPLGAPGRRKVQDVFVDRKVRATTVICCRSSQP